MSLLPEFGSTIFTILAFVMALSIIVGIHEYGHYIVGRWCGIKADVFSLGFGPVIFARMDRRGTRWQIAAIPLGGYVKFAGDSNAASGPMPEDSELPQGVSARQTMLGAPIWARSLTVAAGPVFNFILSILVFAMIIMWSGVPSRPVVVKETVSLPETITLGAGDKVLEIMGQDATVEWPLDIEFPKDTRIVPYTVERSGERMTVDGPNPLLPVVSAVIPRTAASDARVQKGDVILQLGGQDVYDFQSLKDVVESSQGTPQELVLWRDDAELAVTLVPKKIDTPDENGNFITHWRIGIVSGSALTPDTQFAPLGQSLSRGVEQTWYIVNSSVSGLISMIFGEISTCNISGPIGIAETSGVAARAGLQDFIWFVAVLSTAVGFLNLFPIPILDGGHLVFYAAEAVTGKKPSAAVVNVLMAIGAALILGLMVFGVSNDLFC
jgi:regulator of sigma E protease